MLLLFWSIPASAATLALDVELGFYGHFQLHSWTPMTVLFENRGRAVNGTLEVIVTSGSELLGDIRATTYAMDVELPYNAKKSAAFTARLDTFTHPLRIRLRQGNETLAEQTINLRDGYTTKPFVVVADEKVSPDALATFPDVVFSTNVRPRFLPDVWYGYDSVRLLVMNADMVDALNGRQFEALTTWIKQGGTLLVTSGMNAGILSGTRFQELLPLQMVGSKSLQEIQAFQEFCGEPLRSDAPFLVSNVRIPQAEAFIVEQQTPILLKKMTGNGQILFLALDAQSPPFSRWPGRAAFWQKMLEAHVMPETADVPRIDREHLLSALFAHIPASLPTASLLIAVFFCYLLAIALFFRAFGKRAERRIWFGLALLLFIAILSSASYWFAVRMLDDIRQMQNGLLHLHLSQQRQVAAGEYVIGVYAMQAAPYSLDFSGQSYPLTALFPKNAPRQAAVPFRLYETPSGQQISGELGKWSQMFFSLNLPVELPISGHLSENSGAFTFRGEHLMRHAISNAYLTFGGNVYAVGDLSGEQVERLCQKITFDAATDFVPENATASAAKTSIFSRLIYGKSASDFLQRDMQRELAAKLMPRLRDAYRERADVACLMGWLSEPFIQAKLEGERTSALSLTVLTWEIPKGSIPVPPETPQ